MANDVPRSGLFDRRTAMFGTWFRRRALRLVVWSWVVLLIPMAEMVTERLLPCRELQLTVMILLTTAVLLLTAMPTLAWPTMVSDRGPQLTNEKLTMLLGPMETRQWLLVLAAMLPAAFPLTIEVLTSGARSSLASRLDIAI